MRQKPMQPPPPPPPPDSWEVRRQKEMAEREQEKMARKRRASMERANSGQRSGKMFSIEHGPAHETAGEMYRRIKAESKRPKNHAFLKGVMKGFSAAMMAQKAARDDLDKRMRDYQADDMDEVAESRPVDTELDDFRAQISLGENQTLVRLRDERGKSTGFGVVDMTEGASLKDAPEMPTLPNGEKPVYIIPDREMNKRHGIPMPELKPKTKQAEHEKADLSPAGRKLPDISHIKEPSRESEHAFEMAGSR